jgi:hypothetical protein
MSHTEGAGVPASGGLKPGPGTPILGPSVEAKAVSDLCTEGGFAPDTRARLLTWLAEGARDVAWALCSLPRARWAEQPPAHLDEWPALRHARFLVLSDQQVTLPAVRHALGETSAAALPSVTELARVEATWDPTVAIARAEDIVTRLSQTRFELLQRLESAPDDVWQRPLPSALAADAGSSSSTQSVPLQLDWLLLQARLRDLEHLAAIWRVALYWDRVSLTSASAVPAYEPAGGFPLHPADRPEESH